MTKTCMSVDKQRQFEVHPIANIFPMISEDAFQALKEDIRVNGQCEMAHVWKGQLIDGRNRLRACNELGKELECAELDDCEDPVVWVISHNLHRRHLSETQRSMVGARLATMKRGSNQHTKEDPQICGSTTESVSKLLNVSERSVEAAKRVIADGSKTLIELVENDQLKVSAAEKLIKAVPEKKQQEAIAKEGVKAIKDASKPPKEDKPKAGAGVVKNVANAGGSAVKQFKELFSAADATGKRAIWLWLCDNYEGAT